MDGITSINDLPQPILGWQMDLRELDGEACMAMFGLISAGDERKLHFLTFDPIPPAILDGGNASRMEVAITLDDGFNMDLRILDLLESYGIRCPVFPIGSVAELHPDWLRRMNAHGWEVANHTYTHPITHFGGYHTYETLQYIIPRMLAQGYHFVTLSQLFTP